MRVCPSCQKNPLEEGKFICSVSSHKQTNLREMVRKNEKKPYSNANFEEALRVFAKEMELDVKTLYYPGCDTDISPAKTFPNAHIIFVDINHDSVSVLKD